MSMMFLEHIDVDNYSAAVESVFNRIEKFTPTNLPKILQIPGIATTVLQHKSVVSDDFVSSPSVTGDVANVVNATTDYAWRQNPRTSPAGRPAARSSNARPFQGTCHACGRNGHHAQECHFMQKLQRCMTYMDSNRRLGDQNARFYRSKNQYDQRRDKVKVLQDQDLIEPDLNPDIFLDIVDDLVIADLQTEDEN